MTTVAARNRRLPTPRRMSLSSVIGAVSAVAFFQGNERGLPRKPCDSASGARILFAMLSRVRPAGFIEPCLPSPADKPPSGANWIHEIKHDGYRDPVGIRLLTGEAMTGRTVSRLSWKQ
jgi:ATP-dependent DNA ligase